MAVPVITALATFLYFDFWKWTICPVGKCTSLDQINVYWTLPNVFTDLQNDWYGPTTWMVFIQFNVALEENCVCLDYQSLKDYFSKTTKWKLNILVSISCWKIALYCKLNFIFQNKFNQKLCNIMRKKLGYVLWLKIACQITCQKFVFPLQDLTTAYKTVSRNFDIWFHSFVMS